MEHRWITIDTARLYTRTSAEKSFDRKKPTIVFVHGLGESGACFAEAWDLLTGCNLIIPDLPGFGHSEPSRDNNHSTKAQAERVLQLIDRLNLKQVTLVGHSWGGDVATLACTLDSSRITLYCNIEGDLHHENVFISHDAARAFRSMEPKDFENWLKQGGFVDFVLSWSHGGAPKRYLDSVRLCDPQVFGITAEEIVKQCKAAARHAHLEWGRLFAALPVTRVYCWGSRSIDRNSMIIKFLEYYDIEHCCFEGASHWVMEDRPAEFYRFLLKKVQNYRKL